MSLLVPVTSSTRTRRGGSCLKDIYQTFLIYRTCMRRAPAKPVRTLRKWCPVAHVTFEAPLRTSHFSLQSSHSTLHTALFTLHPWQSTLHTPHFTVHTSHFSLSTFLHCGKKKGKATPAATAAQTRYLSSSPTATLHGKTQGFVLRLPPQNIAHLTTSLSHHLPSSPPPFLTIPLHHHFPLSPLPFNTTSLFVTTSLRHHFPSFVHFPSSLLPIVPTSLPHHSPSSSLPFVTTSLRHHFHCQHPSTRSIPPLLFSFVMYCYVMY